MNFVSGRVEGIVERKFHIRPVLLSSTLANPAQAQQEKVSYISSDCDPSVFPLLSQQELGLSLALPFY